MRRYVPVGPVCIAATAICLLAVLLLNVQYVSLQPGPARDVIDLIELDGEARDDVTGELLLTTVSLRLPPITVMDLFAGLFDPNDLILPRDAVFRDDETDEEADRIAAAQMITSQESAGAAALSYLGYDVKKETVGVLIVDFPAYGPARTTLNRGDIVTSADGIAIEEADDFTGAIDRLKVGEPVVLEVLRGSKRHKATLTTVASPQDPNKPVIGVEFSPVPIERARLPVKIEIDAKGIGGPSAGLMYALGIVDLLDEKDLTNGRRIAGTGEIDIDGVVGAVGGVRQKVVSVRDDADLFVVPADELEDACESAGEMPVVAVRTLKEAVRALREPAYAARHTCP